MLPSPHQTPVLYRIDECSDLMADACVCNEQGEFIFLSVWARDTAIQQFIARLTLGRAEDGLDQFHLITEQGRSEEHTSSLQSLMRISYAVSSLKKKKN